ncbi:MAG: hypothetical protein ACRCYU_15570, partial [Nocardioides sp.]
MSADHLEQGVASRDAVDPESDDFDAPFAVALRTAIANRGVSLTWLHRRLGEEAHPISIATLSYWRSGQRQPEHARSRDALGILEDLLR